ncbi:MAG: hypothetical protein ACE14T_03230 [Syntrophales bacterium]
MARKSRRERLDDFFKDKAEEFERGIDRERDDDLDGLIWELGDYENREPISGEESEFKELIPAEEELVDKEIDEYGIETEERLLEPVQALLKIEISGDNYEIVCGRISEALLRKLRKYCEKTGISLSNAWYDDKVMKKIAGKSWVAWHERDEFVHEIGLGGRGVDAFDLSVFIDYEQIEDLETDSIRVSLERMQKPVVGKGEATVAAGSVHEATYNFELEINEEFDIRKLEFVFKDFSALGFPEPLLVDITYDGEAMYFEYENGLLKDMLDVKIIDASAP